MTGYLPALRSGLGRPSGGQLASARARASDSLGRAGGPSVLVLAVLWICRRLLFTGELPAGTDVLDLITRAQQNAHWGVILSPWGPSGLGEPRQVSLDNLLGLVVLVTGDAPRAVAVLLTSVLLGAGLSAYWVVNRWYRDRVVATVAGLVYMTAQASLGRVASGWLHYELLVALAPLLIHLWIELVRRFEPVRALLFALGLSAIVFARQDIVLWIVPALLVYVPVRLVGPDRRRTILNVGKATAVVVPTVLALSLYFVVPLAAGIRAPWVTTGQVFEAIRFNLVDRSLGAYQSLLGLGRDLGYLPFNGEAWWNHHPWLPQPAYYELQAIVVAAALGALWARRDERTLYLVLLAVVAAFLGKGIRGPLGQPYWFGVQHLPIFGSLRGPNRWLIEQSFCYATLFAVSLRAGARQCARRGLPAFVGRAVIVIGAAVALIPVAPTLLSGFRTWQPTPGQQGLLRTIASKAGNFTVATVPYDQSMRFVQTPSYSGWEHDLGVESALYTGHSAISTNSWDQRGSDFVDYTASLLEQRDPAFASILGSVGVRYLVGFRYPSETGRAAGGTALFAQQRALARDRGVRRVAATSGGSLYRTDAAPLLSFRTNLGVILGGRSGLAAFSDLPGIRLRDWAVQTADDLLGGGGSVRALTAALDRSDTIVFADTSIRDLSVLATRPVARIPGITSDPGLARRVGLLLNDESARLGSLADPAVPPPGLVAASRERFRLTAPHTLDLWTRILETEDAGTVTFSVDGRVARRLLPLEAGGGRFAWIRVGRFRLGSGTHTIAVAGTRSAFGQSFEVDESRLIEPGARAANAALIHAAVLRNARKVQYVVSLSNGPYDRSPADRVPGQWAPQDPGGVRSTTQGLPTGDRAFRLHGNRPFYTFAVRTFDRPQNWSGRSYALLRYWSDGAGTRYRFMVDLDPRHVRFASYALDDTSRGWHAVALPLDGGWPRVVGLRVSTGTKTEPGHIVLGGIDLLFSRSLSKTVALPTLPGGGVFVQGAPARGVVVHLRRGGNGAVLHLRFPRRLAVGAGRVWARSRSRHAAAPAVPVRFSSSGSARFAYSFRSARRGMLVLAQTYDGRWQVDEGGEPPRSATPTLSLVSGFVLGRGTHTGFVAFRGRSLVPIGIAGSLAVLAGVLGAIALLARRRRQGMAPSEEPSFRTTAPRIDAKAVERTGLVGLAIVAVAVASPVAAVGLAIVAAAAARRWDRSLLLGTFLLLVAPLLTALQHPAAADGLAVGVVAAVVIAAGQLALARRSKAALS